MNTYGLDCAHHYSASNLAGDAFLKICRANIQLLTNREHLEIVEKMIRGGLASVYDERYFKANNKYMENYNSALESTFGFMVDANNLYGGIMKTEHLPVGDFLLVEVPLEQVLNTLTDSPIGYIFEVDLTYPHNIRDLHRDFPLAPTKEIVPDEWLSTYQRVEVQCQHAAVILPQVTTNRYGQNAVHAPLPESSTLCTTWSGC